MTLSSNQDFIAATLTYYKDEKKLPLLARRLVEAEESLSIEEKSSLGEFFDYVLDNDQGSREMSLETMYDKTRPPE